MDAVIAAGYPYEFVGICYYILFVLMGRKRFAARYSSRSRALTVVAAIAMVGCVPFHYATTFAGTVVMFGLAIAALISVAVDALVARKDQTR